MGELASECETERARPLTMSIERSDMLSLYERPCSSLYGDSFITGLPSPSMQGIDTSPKGRGFFVLPQSFVLNCCIHLFVRDAQIY